MTHAVVLGTGCVALNVAHGFAKAGIDVIHVTTKPDDFASHSRFVKRKQVAPEARDAAGLLAFLTHGPVGADRALLVPVNDPPLEFVARHVDQLAPHYRLTTPSWTMLGGINDKSQLYRRAHAIGVPAPNVWFPQSSVELEAALGAITYPCLLKPHQTPPFFAVYGEKVLMADNVDALRRKFADTQRHALSVMVSEIVPGPDDAIFNYACYIDRGGRVAAEACVQKLRKHPPGYGVGCVVKTIPLNAEMREYSLRLLRSYGYTGFSSTEFKRDQRTGQFRLMEINTRPILWLRLLTNAGINIPQLMFMDQVTGAAIPPQRYRTDMYWIHNFLDLWELRRNQRAKAIAWRDFFHPYRQSPVYAVPLFADPMPFLMSAAQLVKWRWKRKAPQEPA